jgi:hypothetical protein
VKTEAEPGERPKWVAIALAWTLFLAVLVPFYWLFGLVAHLAYRKEHIADELPGLKAACDGADPGPTGPYYPGTSSCKWLFHWWQGPAWLTVALATAALVTGILMAMTKSSERSAL